MSRRYCVGVLLCMVIMCVLYCADYKRMSVEKGLPFEEGAEEFAAEPADGGREERLYQYCLKEKEGVVYVYLADGVTLYEETGIRVECLPENVREEVSQGKYLVNREEMDALLEECGG